jgi:hypothetical protein
MENSIKKEIVSTKILLRFRQKDVNYQEQAIDKERTLNSRHCHITVLQIGIRMLQMA